MDKIYSIEDMIEVQGVLQRLVRSNFAEYVLVESALPVRRFLSNLLKKEGYGTCQEFSDGKEALKFVAKSEKPCVLIYEAKNSALGAADFLKVMKQLGKTEKVSVLATVERQTKKVIQDLVSLGAKGVLAKPVTTSEILKKLEDLAAL